jgi:predicted transcriptional regulator
MTARPKTAAEIVAEQRARETAAGASARNEAEKQPKVRVYELAKELGLTSKIVLTRLNDMGEFVRSAASTIEEPTLRRLQADLEKNPPRQPKTAAQIIAEQPAREAAAQTSTPNEAEKRPKVRVYELAKELGLTSKIVLTRLNDMGEFVRSAASTIEEPTLRRLRADLEKNPPSRIRRPFMQARRFQGS